MGNSLDMEGRKFGKLIALSYAGKTKDYRDTWLCECECGNKKVILGKSLRCGLTKSCGCDFRRKPDNLLGQRFGRLIVIQSAEKNKSGRTAWICKCNCGVEKIATTHDLRNGSVSSCGCYLRERLCTPRNIYGLPSKTYKKLNRCHFDMVRRCYDSNAKDYADYGRRGIGVCDEWREDFHSFARFAIDNGWDEKLTIERIDYAKGYLPCNCTFIPSKEQAKNRRSSIKITINGNTKCLFDWCKVFGVSAPTVYTRYHKYGDADVKKLFATGGR